MAGYIAAILIGVSLGLLGGGGSILTIPVLVYLFGVDAVLATTYSLFIVGTSALLGSSNYYKQKLINFKTAIAFGIASTLSVILTRTYLLPNIPEIIFKTNAFTLTKPTFLMIGFATLMIFASYNMIKKRNEPTSKTNQDKVNFFYVSTYGLLVGILTGMVGAGGGFIIVPALVNIMKTPIKKAIGTSLIIISINSFVGFVASVQHSNIQWQLLLSITAVAIIGTFIGGAISTKVNSKNLKPAFGWFVLIIGLYILLKEFFL